jgi:hypothetical protein
MKGRVVLLALAVPAVFAGVFASTSFGVVSSTLVVRSGASTIDLDDKSQKLKLQAKEPIHVAIRYVTADAGDAIGGGWRGHAGPSLIVVADGSLTATEPDGNTCGETAYTTGSTFVHSEDAHRFVAGASGAKIYILYFMPEGATPGAIAMPAPAVCS